VKAAPEKKEDEMKRARVVWLAAALALLLAATHLAGQDQERKTRVFFGPCLGVGSVILDGDTFNSNMQRLYPSDRWYYPVYTQIGLEAGQVVPIGSSRSSFAFHEIFLLGGLDQGMPMPTLNVLFGYYSPFGLEAGLGPHFAVMAPTGAVKLDASVAYFLAYFLRFDGLTMPIRLVFVPLPSYSNPQVSLLVGFGFEGLE
jgi:hypothetical protein